MSDDLEVLEAAPHVALLEICRPPNNYFDIDLIGEIADSLERLAEQDCRAVVLCSEGKHFCAGADFGHDIDTGTADGPHLYDQALRIFSQPLPVVVAVQGAAIGGGLGLALAADRRIATPESRFAANFARLGFHHGFGLTVTLPLAVGHSAALDLLYTGRRIGGEEALALGLCDRLVSSAELRSSAVEAATAIATSAPMAVRSIRQTMRGPLVELIRAATELERSEQERLMTTTDWSEGIAAAAARRTPDFSGH